MRQPGNEAGTKVRAQGMGKPRNEAALGVRQAPRSGPGDLARDEAGTKVRAQGVREPGNEAGTKVMAQGMREPGNEACQGQGPGG
jgi:hypothetical protein